MSQGVRDQTAAQLEERRMSPEEFETLENTPLPDAEREHLGGLIDWFRRRYPTPLARLEYIRRRARALRRMRAHLRASPGVTPSSK